MKYNELNISANPKPNRKGRGIAAGQGKTAGRGTKGQNARSGGGVRPGFEGGQNPLMQRLPKLRGFLSHRPKVETVYTDKLNNIGTKVDNFSLADAKLISSPFVKVKLISGKNELKKKVSVSLQGASASAKKQIEKTGGTFSIVDRPKRSKAESDKPKTSAK